MILFGPPGTGKTTLARIVAARTGSSFEELSAVDAGKADVRAVTERARDRLAGDGRRTILFLDEIHRFTKAQQDALLPLVESGLIILIGATTESPHVGVIAALLSRCTLYELKSLDPADLNRMIDRGAAALEVTVTVVGAAVLAGAVEDAGMADAIEGTAVGRVEGVFGGMKTRLGGGYLWERKPWTAMARALLELIAYGLRVLLSLLPPPPGYKAIY